jgi:hypothetical protein
MTLLPVSGPVGQNKKGSRERREAIDREHSKARSHAEKCIFMIVIKKRTRTEELLCRRGGRRGG